MTTSDRHLPRRTHLWRAAVTTLILLSAASQPAASDWAQWLGGGGRTVATPGPPAGALEVAFRRAIGSGYSGLSIRGPHLATMMSSDAGDVLVLLDATTGDERWQRRLARPYRGHDGSIDGPLSTPAIDGERVYGIGPRGQILAVRIEDGEIAWKSKMKALGARQPHYGYATSPLLEGSLVIIQAGAKRGERSLAALARATGEVAWQSQRGASSYSSPSAVTLAGRRRIVAQTDDSVFGVDPTDGGLLWRLPIDEGGSWTPLPIDQQRVFFSLGDVATLVQVARSAEGFAATWRWRVDPLAGSIGAIVAIGEHLYGHDGRELSCVRLSDGEKLWSESTDGQVLGIGDRLLVLDHKDGTLRVVAAEPGAYREIARTKIMVPVRVETPMSYAGNLVYVRTPREIIAVRLLDGPPAVGTVE